MSLKRFVLPCLYPALWCTACSLQPTKPVAIALPPAFERSSANATPRWPSSDWYRGFASGELNELIAQAEGNNLDLAKARFRVMQADARARQAHAAILPRLDASADINYLTGHSVNGSAR